MQFCFEFKTEILLNYWTMHLTQVFPTNLLLKKNMYICFCKRRYLNRFIFSVINKIRKDAKCNLLVAQIMGCDWDRSKWIANVTYDSGGILNKKSVLIYSTSSISSKVIGETMLLGIKTTHVVC